MVEGEREEEERGLKREGSEETKPVSAEALHSPTTKASVEDDGEAERKRKKGRTRIRLFPEIRRKLEEERTSAKNSVESSQLNENDKDAVAQAYANTCLFNLRQVRNMYRGRSERVK